MTYACPCGEKIVEATFHGDRAIAGFGKREAPITIKCAAGHISEHWISTSIAYDVCREISELMKEKV